jgi:hypothetical protein
MPLGIGKKNNDGKEIKIGPLACRPDGRFTAKLG